MRNVVRAMVWVLIATCASGCALFRDPTPPAFEQVALDSSVERNDEGELEGDMTADTMLKNSLKGGGAGAVTAAGVGAGAGALAAGFCGPFYAACLAPSMGFFALAFAPFGLGAGMVAGSVSGLSSGNAGAVNEILDQIESRDLNGELYATLVASVPAERQTTPDRAQGRVTARIDEFDLHQHISQRLSLSIRGSLVQEWTEPGEAEPSTHTCDYEFRTETHDVEAWLLDGGQPLHDAVSTGITSIATWMGRDLEAFATRTGQPEMNGLPETCFQG